MLLLIPILVQGQSMGRFENLSSVRYGLLVPNKTEGKQNIHFIGADFLCPIEEEEFYIGGKLSFIVDVTRTETHRVYHSPTEWTAHYDEKKKVRTIYPEVTFRKYLWEVGLCPYVQLNASYASSSLFVGIKPQIMIFELDVSGGYHLPFYGNPTERDPFMKRGFQFTLGISVPFGIFGIDI